MPSIVPFPFVHPCRQSDAFIAFMRSIMSEQNLSMALSPLLL